MAEKSHEPTEEVMEESVEEVQSDAMKLLVSLSNELRGELTNWDGPSEPLMTEEAFVGYYQSIPRLNMSAATKRKVMKALLFNERLNEYMSYVSISDEEREEILKELLALMPYKAKNRDRCRKPNPEFAAAAAQYSKIYGYDRLGTELWLHMELAYDRLSSMNFAELEEKVTKQLNDLYMKKFAPNYIREYISEASDKRFQQIQQHHGSKIYTLMHPDGASEEVIAAANEKFNREILHKDMRASSKVTIPKINDSRLRHF